MKTLLASIIIGLLAMSPAIAAQQGDSGYGHGQTGTQHQMQQDQMQQDRMQHDQMQQDRMQHDQMQQDRMHQPGERRTEVQPREGYDRVSPDLISVNDLQNADVYDAQDENVGSIEKVLVTQEGEIEKVVVDVGGFLGMGARSVALDFDEIDIHKDNDDDLRVYIDMTEEELRNKPEFQENN
ncbi:PRC-barrel domain-containing protein [Desulfonatronum parangueonense]